MKYAFFIFTLLLFCTPALAQKPIIAVIGSESGRLAYLHQDMFRAARYAVDEINVNGGLLSQQLEIVNLDNASESETSAHMAEKAVAMDVACVIGPMVSSHAVASAKVLQKAGIPMIATTATAPQVTLVGDYIFRACFTDAFQGRALAYFVFHQLHLDRAAILQQTNETYSASLTDAFSTAFAEVGGRVDTVEYYRAEQTDFSRELDAVRQSKAKALLIPGYAHEAASIISQARGMGMTIPILGGDAWGNKVHTLADKSVLTGCFQLRHWHRSTSNDLSRTFLHGYESIYGPMLQDVGALAYDGVQLFAAAARTAGSFEGKAIRNALLNTETKGVTGKIRLDQNGDPVKSALILTYRNGKPAFFMILEP